MSAEQRGHLTPASAPCHGANKKNQPGHASPGGVQTHCRGQAGPFLPQSCFRGTATARSWGGGGPSFAGSAENSNNLRVSRTTICCCFCMTCSSPLWQNSFSLFLGGWVPGHQQSPACGKSAQWKGSAGQGRTTSSGILLHLYILESGSLLEVGTSLTASRSTGLSSASARTSTRHLRALT